MIPDIFSSFDPIAFSTIINPLITLSTTIFIILSLQITFWLSINRIITSILIFIYTIIDQLSRTNSSYIKGLSTILSSIFILLIFINLSGLNPYTLSLSSHLIFTLLFGLPTWILIIISSATYKPKAFVAHFLPDGAPAWLNPFLILIETTRITVRPLTLSFRLAANIRAGHIVLRLINLYTAPAAVLLTVARVFLLLTSLGYLLFEIAICLIQAYIFCLLLSLYSNDHAH